MGKIVLIIAAAWCLATPALAQQRKDAPNCQDYPLLRRLADYWIESCVQKPSDSYKFYTGKTYDAVQGKYWYIRYQPPAGQAAKPSAEVLRHFEAAIRSAGGDVVYADSSKETLKLDKDGKEHWIEAWADHTGKYILTIVEKTATPQQVATSEPVKSRPGVAVPASAPTPPPPAPPAYIVRVTPTEAIGGTEVTFSHNLGKTQQFLRLEPAISTSDHPNTLTVLSWDATTARALLPFFPGKPKFTGYIQVGSLAKVPFTYLPRLETQTLTLNSTYLDQSSFPNSDTRLTGPQDPTANGVQYDWNGVFGGKGEDEFFRNARLGEGWTVQAVRISVSVYLGHAGASVVDSRIGTDSPYVKVHWWGDAFSSLHYGIAVDVKGPAGGNPCPNCAHSKFGL